MPTGAVIGGVVAAAGALGGAAMSADAAGDASGAQQRAARSAARMQRDQYNQSRNDLSPYRQYGYSALNALGGMAGISGGPATAQGFLNFLSQESADQINPVHLQTIRGFNATDLADLRARLTGAPVAGAGVTTAEGTPQITGDTLGAFNANERAALLGMLDRYETMAGGAAAAPAGYETGPLLFPLEDLKKATSLEAWDKSPEMAGVNMMLQRGLQQRDRAAAATGNLRSGERLKALSDYTTQTALGGYGQFYGRRAGEVGSLYDSRVNERDKEVGRLQTLAGFGQNATNTGVNLGQQFASNMGNLALAGGQAQAAGAVGQANAWGGAFNQIGGMAGNLYGQYQQQQMMNRMMPAGNMNAYQPTGAVGSYGWQNPDFLGMPIMSGT